MLLGNVMKSLNRLKKISLLGLLILGIVCCLGYSTYRIAVWKENKICYARLADKFSSDPSYSSIGNAILDQIKNELGPNFLRHEVILAMSSIAPVVESKEITLSKDETKQIIFLNTCRFVENGFDYITNGATLKTKFSDREMDKTLIIGFQPIPLNQDVESSHREGQTGFEIIPNTMTNTFEMANCGQHG